jgi:hypothetical protein
MPSSISRLTLILGGAAVLLAAFFITLKILNYWGGPIQEPAYRAEALPHLSSGQSLDFRESKNVSALLSGWSAPEPNIVWSDGHAAFIGFIVDWAAGAGAPKQVILHTGIFLAGTLNEQHVQVWSAGKKLAEYDLKDQPPEFELRIPLGEITVSNGMPLILGFYLPDVIPAKDVAPPNPDPRLLGLSMSSLKLAP